MDVSTEHPDEVFYTDKELRGRWKCSAMKLWRLRKKKLLKSFKVGETGMNLTAESQVKALEAS